MWVAGNVERGAGNVEGGADGEDGGAEHEERGAGNDEWWSATAAFAAPRSDDLRKVNRVTLLRYCFDLFLQMSTVCSNVTTMRS